jgi:hypothetical protein
VYITKTFKITTHVFALIFLDSLISTTCNTVTTFLDASMLTGLLQPNYLIIFLSFFFTYFPNCCGAALTLMISLIRYCLAKKSAKNIQPSNKKVSLIACGIFTLYVILHITTSIIHAALDIPLAVFVEVFAHPEKSRRPLGLGTVFFLQIPNFCYILSLATDIQMLRFLKKSLFLQNLIPCLA